jgi:hypothetical protein
LANKFKRIKVTIGIGLREAGVCHSIGADVACVLAQPHVDRCVAQRPLDLVRLTAWKIDRERYRAVPLYSDGKFGPAIELRDLFQQFLNEVEGNK